MHFEVLFFSGLVESRTFSHGRVQPVTTWTEAEGFSRAVSVSWQSYCITPEGRKPERVKQEEVAEEPLTVIPPLHIAE